MIAYLDSSVLLRIILGQSNRLREWKAITQGVASQLVEVECLRTLDRLRLAGHISDRELSERRETVFRLLAEVHVIQLSRAILTRASQPFPTHLGTLDALHLATALLWMETKDADLTMATHDTALATCARACGLRVVGT